MSGHPDRPAGDSTGITAGMAAADIPLAALSPHPENPRGEDLGDLAELEASIREIGVLEPLVVVTIAAHLAGGWPDPAPGSTHVVLAGHCRRAAAIAAGLDVAPCVIRDDLAGDEALIAMLSENDPGKRRGVGPLAEARAMGELAGRGWPQRKIAQRMGCGQSHVSKRLALLKLPGEAAGALAAGKITAADGVELARLAAHPDRAVKALGEISGNSWDSAARVVDRHLAQVRREQAAAATRAALEAEGLKVVDPGVLGPFGYAQQLRGGEEVLEAHRAAECLLGAASSYSGEAEFYCADPASHEGTAAALPGWSQSYAARGGREDRARAEQDRLRAQAARARREAAARLAAQPISAARAAELVSVALIHRHADAACLKTAVGWLRDAGIGPAGGDAYGYAAHVLAAGGPAEVRRLATAMALAADEQATGAEYGGEWAGRQIGYLGRLATEAGYEPTEWEQGRLEEARGRVRARAELSCPHCGCTHAAPCPDTWPRCGVQLDSDGDGGWRYKCGRHDSGAAAAAEETADVLAEALEDLLIATDPTTAAGALLPSHLADAIEAQRQAYAAVWDGWAGDEPPGPLLDAARGLAAAARPHEGDWTPQLRDALAALAEATGAGGR